MSVIDQEALARIFEGDDDLLADLSTMFVKLLPDIRARLRVAIEERDWKSAEELAHQMKGRLGYFGATNLQTLAKEIEKEAQNNSSDEISDLYDDLFQGIVEMVGELSQLTNLELNISDE
ncbi:MAG: Hpt domain-containing protein [Planctomycetota bacterium]